MPETILPPTMLPGRDRSSLALASVFAGFAVMNSIVAWLWPDSDRALGNWALPLYGAFVAEPVLIGVWAALAAGSLILRLAISAPCLLLLILTTGTTPGAFSHVRSYEFVSFALAGFAIAAASMVVFLIWRRFSGLRIVPLANASTARSPQLKYSMAYLMTLMTVYAIALGVTSHLRFDTSPPPLIFGRDFFISVVIYSGTLVGVVVLTTAAVPLMVLHGRPKFRSIVWSLVPWLVITGIVELFLAQLEEGDSLFARVAALLLIQLGAVVLGIASACALRWGGLRLVKIGPQTAEPPPSINKLPFSNS